MTCTDLRTVLWMPDQRLSKQDRSKDHWCLKDMSSSDFKDIIFCLSYYNPAVQPTLGHGSCSRSEVRIGANSVELHGLHALLTA